MKHSVFHTLNNGALLHRRIASILGLRKTGGALKTYCLMSVSSYILVGAESKQVIL